MSEPRANVDTVYDGFVSRHLNRRLSEPVARVLAKTPVTPNQVTLGAAGIGVLSFVSFVLGYHLLGGVLAQVSSIADGVDGGLARAKNMASPFGGFLDAVLDRYVDGLIILGMVLWSVTHEAYPGIWVVGFLAVVGTLIVSYTRARIGGRQRALLDKGWLSLASRDNRLFLVMLGGLLGQGYLALLFLAVLTNGTVLARLLYSLWHLKAEGSRSPEAASAAGEEERASPPHARFNP